MALSPQKLADLNHFFSQKPEIRKLLDSAADLYGYLLNFTKKFLEQ